MILDILENVRRYLALHPGFEEAFRFLARPDTARLPAGKVDIDGTRVYATVSEEPGRRKESAELEAHRAYIDIQLVLAGTDRMGWKPAMSCRRPSTDYDPQTDLQYFADEPDAWLAVGPGAFAVFFPEDAHMPLISEGPLRKIVVKVAVRR